MKLWGGRFTDDPNALAFRYNASLEFDWRLAPYDIQGSIAWAEELANVAVLTDQEVKEIRQGLRIVLDEVNDGSFKFQPTDEDVHTAVERRLTELIGPAAGKLHTGRSRNDQVATDFRLWMLDAIDQAALSITGLQKILLQRAETDMSVIFPGYTHTQRAQPILLSHWWLSHFWPLYADRQRLAQLRQRTAVLPLGSGALAGVPYPLDRSRLALIGHSMGSGAVMTAGINQPGTYAAVVAISPTNADVRPDAPRNLLLLCAALYGCASP